MLATQSLPQDVAFLEEVPLLHNENYKKENTSRKMIESDINYHL